MNQISLSTEAFTQLLKAVDAVHGAKHALGATQIIVEPGMLSMNTHGGLMEIRAKERAKWAGGAFAHTVLAKQLGSLANRLPHETTTLMFGKTLRIVSGGTVFSLPYQTMEYVGLPDAEGEAQSVDRTTLQDAFQTVSYAEGPEKDGLSGISIEPNEEGSVVFAASRLGIACVFLDDIQFPAKVRFSAEIGNALGLLTSPDIRISQKGSVWALADELTEIRLATMEPSYAPWKELIGDPSAPNPSETRCSVGVSDLAQVLLRVQPFTEKWIVFEIPDEETAPLQVSVTSKAGDADDCLAVQRDQIVLRKIELNYQQLRKLLHVVSGAERLNLHIQERQLLVQPDDMQEFHLLSAIVGGEE